MTEQKMPVILSMLACLIMMVTFSPILVFGEPDPMARPTRPKVFTSADELRRYLDHVKDYYSLSGKARYGKRTPSLSITENPWELVRIPPAQSTLLALRQQQLDQLHQIENPLRHQLQREIQNQQEEQEELRQFGQGGQREPSYLYEAMAKYYDEMQ
ncbi:uncharacterized protein LOC105691637 [Athalia rosae]|uniref:uncharacterized protein LOC105691637 n=1 Tax=Athalia rosae TaxID=37344 RepID=UPI0020344AC7|nr:uncharacterized protein LOC105691637 [Athalia rosae]XP_048515999.1 uncharacterized protein LOC105691637 [Athalia rosae]